MKKTLIAASVAALTAGFVAAPAFAQLPEGVEAYVAAELYQPTDSDLDTAMVLEAGASYQHETGVYGEFILTTMDLLDSDADFSDNSAIELNLGYAGAVNEQLGYYAGISYRDNVGMDFDSQWLFVGVDFTVDADLTLGAYFEKNLDSDAKDSQLELRADYTGVEVVDIFAELALGLEDAENKSLEIGVGKEFLPQQVATASFVADLEESDFSYLKFTYTYNF
ncbi:outer membrane beta-barrel protein [Marinospirillum alkaliphilum]|uniref:Outer membrane protein beta-barrel domain-containing protein n=1 Tax=Marinospirillum alkaliphilum DSM 21637 TaxID=1122209 RepID=A0A1K1V7D9_9GAMM|nr:outer membrane beta-barrel protein [Marinospirillum alkaliphilum]SFX21050.1 Outer membrane protein beta-barrel domain-containing protein [Marinospirillum alkaliphilum DSM 21637]